MHQKRKTEKIQGSRNEYHVVKQEEYPIYDGIHDAIISEEDWLLAQDKRKKTGVKNEKIYNTEHQHLLTGIIKCPICGAGLYGSVNRKRKKYGSFYRDYWYYACKHRLEYDGHKCTFKKQIHQEKINEAVVEVIRNIVKNSKFDSAIKEKLDASVDLSKYEKEETYLITQIKQLTAAKERLGSQIDRLDCSDRHYEQKYADMQNRINSLYDEIAEATENLETVQTQIKAIKEQKISQKRIFEFLELFDNFTFDEVTNQNDLDDHTKFMAILATLLGCGGIDEFKMMLPAAYNFEVSPVEIKEIVYQSVAYLGIGRVRPFLDAVNEFLTKKGIKLPLEGQATTNRENRVEKGNEAQVAIFGENMRNFQNIGDEDTRHINKWLAGNCFGDYYTRNGLNLKQREMITMCFLLAQGGCEMQLKSHIQGNLNIGNDKDFLIKVVSQCMPFIGYPRTLNALNIIKEVAK